MTCAFCEKDCSPLAVITKHGPMCRHCLETAADTYLRLLKADRKRRPKKRAKTVQEVARNLEVIE